MHLDYHTTLHNLKIHYPWNLRSMLKVLYNIVLSRLSTCTCDHYAKQKHLKCKKDKVNQSS